MKPSEIAKSIKEDLLSKPNKKVVFKSFCNGLGTDLIKFIELCSKEVESAKQKRIEELENELKELRK